jgi:hypothetical protein
MVQTIWKYARREKLWALGTNAIRPMSALSRRLAVRLPWQASWPMTNNWLPATPPMMACSIEICHPAGRWAYAGASERPPDIATR